MEAICKDSLNEELDIEPKVEAELLDIKEEVECETISPSPSSSLSKSLSSSRLKSASTTRPKSLRRSRLKSASTTTQSKSSYKSLLKSALTTKRSKSSHKSLVKSPSTTTLSESSPSSLSVSPQSSLLISPSTQAISSSQSTPLGAQQQVYNLIQPYSLLLYGGLPLTQPFNIPSSSSQVQSVQSSPNTPLIVNTPSTVQNSSIVQNNAPLLIQLQNATEKAPETRSTSTKTPEPKGTTLDKASSPPPETRSTHTKTPEPEETAMTNIEKAPLPPPETRSTQTKTPEPNETTIDKAPSPPQETRSTYAKTPEPEKTTMTTIEKAPSLPQETKSTHSKAPEPEETTMTTIENFRKAPSPPPKTRITHTKTPEPKRTTKTTIDKALSPTPGTRSTRKKTSKPKKTTKNSKTKPSKSKNKLRNNCHNPNPAPRQSPLVVPNDTNPALLQSPLIVPNDPNPAAHQPPFIIRIIPNVSNPAPHQSTLTVPDVANPAPHQSTLTVPNVANPAPHQPLFSNQSEEHQCRFCDKSYISKYGKRRHEQIMHSSLIVNDEPSVPTKSKEHECNICGKFYGTKYNRFKHQKNVHSIPSFRFGGIITCSECTDGTSFSFLSKYREHLEQKHGITTKKVQYKFSSTQEFHAWKDRLEADIGIHYSKMRGDRKSGPGTRINTYFCGKSGIFRDRIRPSERKRKMKRQGSVKLGIYCTSSIDVKWKNDDTIHVSLHADHRHHKLDFPSLLHASLTESERHRIEGMILQGVEHHKILDQVREGLGESRLLLLEENDLINISAEFGLNKDHKRHPDDNTSVRLIIKEMDEAGDVLYFKDQGDLDLNNPDISSEVFAFGFMNAGLETYFKHHLESTEKLRLCMDSTHGISNYTGYQITTLIIIDDLNHSFPVAFLISSTVNTTIVKTFFNALKDRIGPVKAHVFLSNDDPIYRNAWNESMCCELDCKPTYLNSSWHTDRSFRNIINSIITAQIGKKKKRTAQIDEKSKITAQIDEKAVIYKMLRTLMDEPTEEHFHRQTRGFLEYLLEAGYEQFHDYFETNYLSESKIYLWPKCFRKDIAITTNNHLESIHNLMTYVFVDGEKMKRLDRLLSALNKIVKNKIFKIMYDLPVSCENVSNDSLVETFQKKLEEKWMTGIFPRVKSCRNIQIFKAVEGLFSQAIALLDADHISMSSYPLAGDISTGEELMVKKQKLNDGNTLRKIAAKESSTPISVPILSNGIFMMPMGTIITPSMT